MSLEKHPNWKCSKCGQEFYDEYATKETDVAGLCPPECDSCGNEHQNIWIPKRITPNQSVIKRSDSIWFMLGFESGEGFTLEEITDRAAALSQAIFNERP